MHDDLATLPPWGCQDRTHGFHRLSRSSSQTWHSCPICPVTRGVSLCYSWVTWDTEASSFVGRSSRRLYRPLSGLHLGDAPFAGIPYKLCAAPLSALKQEEHGALSQQSCRLGRMVKGKVLSAELVHCPAVSSMELVGRYLQSVFTLFLSKRPDFSPVDESYTDQFILWWLQNGDLCNSTIPSILNRWHSTGRKNLSSPFHLCYLVDSVGMDLWALILFKDVSVFSYGGDMTLRSAATSYWQVSLFLWASPYFLAQHAVPQPWNQTFLSRTVAYTF